MDDVHGKEISLQYVTVKVPGQKPRGSKTINTSNNTSLGSNGVSDGLNSLTITSMIVSVKYLAGIPVSS